ncbi:MAG: response regulator [Desulfobacterales bacterium]|nr:response regulator [Desulfobacterales bacterium]
MIKAEIIYGKSYTGELIRISLLAILLVLSVCGVSSGKSRVLYISSYHPGFPTFFRQVEGIKSVFSPRDVFLDIEFMDTKRFPERENRDLFMRSLAYKLGQSVRYDAVIIADDNALTFALEYQERFFRGIPVVFLGVNNIDRALAQNHNPLITGVVEAVSMAETLSLMIRLQPEAKNIVALVDDTPSGQGDLKSFYHAAKSFTDYSFSDISLARMSWQQFLSELRNLDDTASVLLLSAYRDKGDTRLLFDQALGLIRGNLSRPIFHLWAHGLGQGILGGKIISHSEQGRVAAEIVLDILDGKPADRIKVVNESPNKYVFDYNELERHRIDKTLLPADSTLLNKPYHFYRENRILISGVGFIIFTLTLALVWAVVNLYRRRQAERTLRHQEIHLRAVIETIPDLIWLKDPDGVYLSCNLKFERFFGAKESEIKGKTDYDFVDKELADFFRDKDKAAMAANAPVKNEEEVTYADDGHHEFLETVKTPMYDNDGQLVGVLGIARDITERKQSEKEREKLEGELRQSHKMEAIGTMSGGIAHDFNNILGIIIGNTELAMETTGITAPVYENLEGIKKAGLRASDIVRQLLNYSRKTEPEKQNLDIRSLVRRSFKLLRSSIPASIEISMTLSDRIRPVLADPTQVHQVLINLCTNAFHAMEETGGALTIDLSEIELDDFTVTQFQKIDAGRYVQLTVSDTGHGIQPETRAKIFDPYFTTKDTGKGTGMGLAVVMGIVKNHNGAVSVYSEAGMGTTFKVLFPVARGDESRPADVPEELPAGDERILFIDDEKALVNVGKHLLESLGYKVEAMNDSSRALALFQSDPSRFDLIITDMTMPGITGEYLAKAVLEINPGVKLILCTGFSNQIDKEKALALGAHCYLEKPIIKSEMAHAVRNTLDQGKESFLI